MCVNSARMRKVRQDSFICVTWLVHMGDMTHPYVRHDSFVWVTWLVHTSDKASHERYYLFICVTSARLKRCDMTHSYICHDSSIRVKRLFTSDITSSRVWSPLACKGVTWLIHVCHDSSTRMTRLYMSDMTRSYMWHDSFIWVSLLIHMCDLRSPLKVRHDPFIHVTWHMHMGRLRSVGSFKLYVSFAKELLKTDYILQKRPMISRSLRVVATPYRWYDSSIRVTWLMYMNDIPSLYPEIVAFPPLPPISLVEYPVCKQYILSYDVLYV